MNFSGWTANLKKGCTNQMCLCAGKTSILYANQYKYDKNTSPSFTAASFFSLANKNIWFFYDVENIEAKLRRENSRSEINTIASYYNAWIKRKSNEMLWYAFVSYQIQLHTQHKNARILSKFTNMPFRQSTSYWTVSIYLFRFWLLYEHKSQSCFYSHLL